MVPNLELVPGFADLACSDCLSIFFFSSSLIQLEKKKKKKKITDPAISYRSLFDATVQ